MSPCEPVRPYLQGMSVLRLARKSCDCLFWYQYLNKAFNLTEP